MSQSPAQNSDAILAAAKASLQHQRAGGRRSSGPIGQRSAALHRAGQKRKAAKLFFALAAGALALMLVTTLVQGALSLLGMIGGGAALVVALVAGAVMLTLRGKDALPSAPPCPRLRWIWWARSATNWMLWPPNSTAWMAMRPPWAKCANWWASICPIWLMPIRPSPPPCAVKPMQAKAPTSNWPRVLA
jgi:hypothetical protein